MSIKVGVPYILTNKATNTVADWNQTDLKSLIGYGLHGYSNQQWIFEDAGNGLYYIKSGKGPYIVFQGAAQANIPLVLTTSPKQAWKIVADTVDSSAIKVLHPTQQNLCFDLKGSNAAFGTNIILYTIHTGRNQAWGLTLAVNPPPAFDPSFAVAFFLTNLATGTLADVSTSDNKSITGRKKTKTSNQIWFTETVDKAQNLYYIKSAVGTYLSIEGSPSTGKQVIASTTKQRWLIKVNYDNAAIVRIYYPGTDCLLDLTASNPAEGTPIILYPTQNPGINQQFRVEPAQ